MKFNFMLRFIILTLLFKISQFLFCLDNLEYILYVLVLYIYIHVFECEYSLII